MSAPETPTTTNLREPAPAKLNLRLRVLGRRDDGLHRLESLVVPLPWGDDVEVRLTPHRGPELAPVVRCTCPGAPALDGPTNLAARAAARLLATHPEPLRCDLRIHKRIPVGAGLGGGSSDAAATLRALARLRPDLAPPPRLSAVAAGLGADVPVCLLDHPAWVTGWGQHLDPVDRLPTFALCLVHPALTVLTRDVFAAHPAPPAAGPPASPASSVHPATPRTLSALGALVENDLWPTALAMHPALEQPWQALADQRPVNLGMSGSGPTLFGLFEGGGEATAAATALQARGFDARMVLFEGSPRRFDGKRGRSIGSTGPANE